MIRTLTFTETATGVTYTAVTSIPPGFRLLDVLIETTVAWTAATAPVTVGDADAADALVKAFNMAAVGFTAGGSLAGAQGTAWGDSIGTGLPYSGPGTGKLYPTGSLVTAVLSPTVPGGPTGVSSVSLLLEQVPLVRRASVV